MEDFNMELLLKEVEIRNLLWDINNKNYGKKAETTEAWAEVCRSLFPDFDKRNLKDRYVTEELVKNKYKNARDTFVKRMRTESIGKGQSKFRHEESLMFLKEMYEAKMKYYIKKKKSSVSKNFNLRRKHKTLNRNKSSKRRSAQVRNTSVSQRNLRTKPTVHYREPTPSSSDENDKNTSTTNYSLRASKRVKFNQDEEVPVEKINIIPDSSRFRSQTDQSSSSLETDDEISSSIEKPLIQSGAEKQSQTVLNYCPSNLSIVSFMAQEEADEDVAFFKSLLMWLKKFNEDEKLVFRSEVLKLIQKIRNSDSYF